MVKSNAKAQAKPATKPESKPNTKTQPKLPKVRAKRDEFLRHVSADEEDSFIDPRESQVVFVAPRLKEGPGKKGKRSMEDMIASMPNDMAQALYVLERVAGLEDQMVKLLKLCTPGARKLAFEQRPSLKRYDPEEG